MDATAALLGSHSARILVNPRASCHEGRAATVGPAELDGGASERRLGAVPRICDSQPTQGLRRGTTRAECHPVATPILRAGQRPFFSAKIFKFSKLTPLWVLQCLRKFLRSKASGGRRRGMVQSW
jgi:hypothetical protein